MIGENFKKQGTNEAEFIRLIRERIQWKLNFYEHVINQELIKDEPDYPLLAETIRSQQKDNPRVMNWIIGKEAAELLEKILP